MVSFGFILGEIVRRVTGRTLGEYLRREIAEPLGIDVHIGLPAKPSTTAAPTWSTSPTSATSSHNGNAPGYPATHRRAPDGRVLRRDRASSPTTNSAPPTSAAWRTAEFPSTNAHVSALGLATFYNALAQGKILSYEHMEKCRISQGGFDTDLVLGPRVADHGWGLGYMLNQRGVERPQHEDLRPRRLGRKSSASSTSSTASATPTS